METRYLKALSLSLSLSLSLVISSVFMSGGLVKPHEVEAVFPGYNGRMLLNINPEGGEATDVWAVDNDGGNLVNLTNHPSVNKDASWSPDGSQIAFTSDRTGNQEIYIMNVDGSGLRQLTNTPGFNNTQSNWSPDGQELAFISNRNGNWEVYVIGVDGSGEYNLTNNPASDQSPQWSPDGHSILIVSTRAGGSSNAIYKIDLDDGEAMFLAGRSRNPSWSPDGQWIIYSHYPVGMGVSRIMVMDKDGGSVSELVSSETLSYAFPEISPDGSLIAYVEEGSKEIWLADWGGIGSQQVVGIVGTYLRWQPLPNTSPALTAKSLTVAYGQSGSVDVLAGAVDEEVLEGEHVRIVSQPEHGVAVVEDDGRVTYAPASGFSGSDSLTYEVCDSFLLDQKCAVAVLGITVAESNAPVVSVTQVAGKAQSSKVVTSSLRPTFSGTATPHSTVRIEIHSDPIVLTTTADASGDWSVTPTQDLPAGEHAVYISATLNGQTTSLDSFVLGIQAIPNTGASTVAFAYAGVVLLVVGVLGLGLSRRKRRLVVPALFA